jgi:hypothetical protein
VPRDVSKLTSDDIRRLAGRLRLLADAGTKRAKLLDRPNQANREDASLAADILDDYISRMFGEQQPLPFVGKSDPWHSNVKNVDTGDKL